MMTSDEKVLRIKEIVNDGNPALVAALKELVTFIPMDGRYPLKAVSKVVNGNVQFYESASDQRSLGDEEVPFFTESFLYNLLGKEDARTLLANLHQVLAAAGLDRFADSAWTENAVTDAIERKEKLAARQKKRQ